MTLALSLAPFQMSESSEEGIMEVAQLRAIVRHRHVLIGIRR